jgi:predicted deacylase
MRLVIEGRPNKLIADALGISVRTVEVHRARVFDKMNVKSAVELANLLREHGAVPPRPGASPQPPDAAAAGRAIRRCPWVNSS